MSLDTVIFWIGVIKQTGMQGLLIVVVVGVWLFALQRLKRDNFRGRGGFSILQALLLLGLLLFFGWEGYTTNKPNNDGIEWIHEAGDYGL